jgi:protein-tyrosine kinase
LLLQENDVDSIRQAVELARSAKTTVGEPTTARTQEGTVDTPARTVRLDAVRLEASRVVAHGDHPIGRYYDMLRTQVVQEMHKNNWQFLAVTSATAGCGKSVTACNLALSIARLPDCAVLLVDLDLLKPKVAQYLGIKDSDGVMSLLSGASTLSNTIVEASISRSKLLVLPGEVCRTGSSEWMASQTMKSLLQSIRRTFRSRIVIFDMPPMLVGDDVISILPQMDAVLLVAGVGNTSLADVRECQKHLKAKPVVRVVVNKVTSTTETYQAYY